VPCRASERERSVPQGSGVTVSSFVCKKDVSDDGIEKRAAETYLGRSCRRVIPVGSVLNKVLESGACKILQFFIFYHLQLFASVLAEETLKLTLRSRSEEKGGERSVLWLILIRGVRDCRRMSYTYDIPPFGIESNSWSSPMICALWGTGNRFPMALHTPRDRDPVRGRE
jgi:hypothetical protein